MKEEKFLNLIKAALPESERYMGDDAAYISEKDLILTQDTLIEDVHFRTRTISPFYLGKKSIAVNLSDIAASGGIPEYLLISLSMPVDINEKFVKEFYKGIHFICKEYGVFVAGGDLTASEKITVSVCAIGSGKGLVPANRRNAAPGDAVIVTGDFGSSAAGLYLLEDFYKNGGNAMQIPEKVRTKLINSHIDPIPRIKEGRKILELAKKPAMMDSSDGLGDALYKICAMSRVQMEIDFEEIPFATEISEVFQDKEVLIKNILFGGEDYELVATVPEEIYKEIKKEIFVKKIGTVQKAGENSFAYVKFKGRNLLKIDSDALESGLFSHFKD